MHEFTSCAFVQDDSAVLEQTLREANRLLGESGAAPLVEVGGIVNKDAARTRHDGHDTAVSKTFLTDIDVSDVSNDPKVSGINVNMSEELGVRLRALGDVIGPENLSVLRASIQSDLEAVCRIARSQAAPAKAAADAQVRPPRSSRCR